MSEAGSNAAGSNGAGNKAAGSNADGSNAAGFDFMSWTDADVKEFQAIWLSLVGTTDEELKEMAITLLLWMFEHVPNMKKHFQKFANKSNDAMVSDERFLMHAQGVIVMLNKLINAMSNPDEYNKMSLGIVKRHLRLVPPVGLQYFKDFRDSIHLFVYEMTGYSKKSRPSELFYQFIDGFVKSIQAENVSDPKLEDSTGKGDDKNAGRAKGGCCILT